MGPRTLATAAFLAATTVVAKNTNNVKPAPSVEETKALWAKRLQELSALLADKQAAMGAFEEFASANNRKYEEENGEKEQRFEIVRENVKKGILVVIRHDIYIDWF